MDDRPARPLDELDDRGRGDFQNRIKEPQSHLSANCTSAGTMRASQVRLFFSSIASTLLDALRQPGLAGTELAKAPCQTIRLKLLQLGALVQALWLDRRQPRSGDKLGRSANLKASEKPSLYRSGDANTWRSGCMASARVEMIKSRGPGRDALVRVETELNRDSTVKSDPGRAAPNPENGRPTWNEPATTSDEGRLGSRAPITLVFE